MRELGGFHLHEPIAEGSLSTVWRARHATGLAAAVKVLRVAAAPDEAERFRNEIRAVARLTHPGIVAILDHGEAPAGIDRIRAGAPWLAMELVGGGTLSAARITTRVALSAVARSLLEALAHAHTRGVLHRDLKPANVLLADADPRAGVKLTDFGIAWTRPDPKEHGPTGTLPYMAPEQIEVEPLRFGPWTDLYGLGCLLWEVLTGAPPYRDEPTRPLAIAHLLTPPPPLRPRFEVAPGLEKWLHRLLEKEPRDRFPTAADALAAFPDPGAPPGWAEVPRPPTAALQAAGLRLFGLRDVPLVGREAERALLWDAVAAVARDRNPRVIVVRGAAGAGRSRLLRWLHERVGETGVARSFLLRPSEDGAEVRTTLLASLGGSGLDGDALREHLAWRLLDVDDAGVRDELASVLAPPVGREVQPGERHRAVRRWLTELSRSRPVCWIVDDAHAARDAVPLARRLLERDATGSCAALIVISIRDDALGEEEPSPMLVHLVSTGQSVRLEPPGRVDRLVLLQRHLAVEAHLAARLDEETGGNPLLATEILRDHVERGWLVPGAEGLTLAQGRDVVVPSDRFGPWLSRLERAVDGDDEGWQIEIAAALGEEVGLAEWDAVGDAKWANERRRVLDTLLEYRLVEPTPTGFRWSHPMVRAAILRQTRIHGRFKEAHRACLRWARRVGGDAERIARHLAALEHWDEAAGPLLDAAEARHAREGPASAWEALRVAEVALERGGIAKRDRRWIRLWTMRARVMQERARTAEALAMLDAAEGAIAHSGDPRDRIAARHVRALAVGDLGQLDEALRLHLENERALADADSTDEQRSITLDALSMTALKLGRLADAARWAAEGEDVLARLAHDGRRGANLVRQANLASLLGDTERALALLDRAEPLVLAYGALTQKAFFYNDRGDVYMRAGRWAEAEPLFVRAMELLRSAGHRAVTAVLNLALCRLHQRRIDEAEALVQESGAPARQAGSPDATAGALVVAVCHAERGAWEAFDQALDRAGVGLEHLAEADFARLLEQAAAVAAAGGRADRADRCRALAREQHARIVPTG